MIGITLGEFAEDIRAEIEKFREGKGPLSFSKAIRKTVSNLGLTIETTHAFNDRRRDVKLTDWGFDKESNVITIPSESFFETNNFFIVKALLENFIAIGGITQIKAEDIESSAIAFAFEVLMPKKLVLNYLKDKFKVTEQGENITYEIIWNFIRDFELSNLFVQQRLAYLGFFLKGEKIEKDNS